MNDINILFSLQGRLNRLRYFLYTIGLMIFQAIATAVLAPVAVGGSGAGGLVPMLAIVAIELVVAWCWIALMVKRLHDLGHSGWYVLGLVAILALLTFIFRDPRVSYLLFVVVGILSFAPGTKGTNRFGPDPLSKDPAPGAAAEN